MKFKLYLLAFAAILSVKSFASIIFTLNKPTPLATYNDSLKLSVNVQSTYQLQFVKAAILSNQVTLYQANASSPYEQLMLLSGLPYDTLTVVITAKDILQNSDSITFKIVHKKFDHFPTLTVIRDSLFTGPYMHVRIEGHDDEGNTKLNLVGPAPNYIQLAQGVNIIDTVIDITSVGNAESSALQSLQALATDSSNQVTSKYFSYYWEPSPYLELITKSNFEANRCAAYGNCNYTYKIGTNYLEIQDNDTILKFYGNNIWAVRTGQHMAWKDSKYLYHISLLNYKVDTLALAHTEDNGIVTNITSFVVDSADGDVVWYEFSQTIDNFYVSNISKSSKKNGGIYGDGAYAINNGNYLSWSGTVIGGGGSDGYNYGPPYTIYFGKIGASNYFTDEIFISDDEYYNTMDSWAVNGGYAAYDKDYMVYLADTTGHKAVIDSSANLVLGGINEKGEVLYNSNSRPGCILAKGFGEKLRISYMPGASGFFYNANDSWYITNGTVIKGYFKVNLNPATHLTNINREVKKDSSYGFAAGDFDNATTGSNAAFEIKITKLPMHGVLYYDGKPIKKDSIISHAYISKITYVPESGFTGADTAWWNASNSIAFASQDALMVFNAVETLPVQLTTFTGENKGTANQLMWQTAQEVNTAYFQLQHSTNANRTFVPLAQVSAAGNSNTVQSYNYTHTNPAAGTNYYRLKMVDKDGKFTYSRIISILNGDDNFKAVVLPNPVHNNITLQLTSGTAQKVQVSVISINGTVLLSQQLTVSAGTSIKTIAAGSLAKGTYFIKVSGIGLAQANLKIIKE